eukprot:Pgem_evm1s7288
MTLNNLFKSALTFASPFKRLHCRPKCRYNLYVPAKTHKIVANSGSTARDHLANE